jgi:hypothetical protein
VCRRGIALMSKLIDNLRGEQVSKNSLREICDYQIMNLSVRNASKVDRGLWVTPRS